MRSFAEVWRRELWMWAVPLALCVANLFVFTFYRSVFAGKVESLESRYESRRQILAAREEERQQIEDFLAALESHQDGVVELYRDHFQTEARRFTRVIQEVKRLAADAGLRLTALSYPEKRFTSHDLIQRNLNFSVAGSYEQLRTFVNFVELSEHFLTLERVSLSGSGGPGALNINIALSTIFAVRDPQASPASEGPAT